MQLRQTMILSYKQRIILFVYLLSLKYGLIKKKKREYLNFKIIWGEKADFAIILWEIVDFGVMDDFS